MTNPNEPPFKRAESLDKPGIVGARWWQESLKTSTVTRRQSMRALLVGGGILGLGILIAATSGDDDDEDGLVERRASLAVQRQYGWNFGAVGQALTFDGIATQPFSTFRLARLVDDLAPRRAEHRPFFVPTLLQSPTTTPELPPPGATSKVAALFDSLRPIVTPEMDVAYQRGVALGALLANRKDIAVVVDLEGAESVAFAAGAAGALDPVFAIDNWPHPRGVVRAHMTVASAAYYQPRFTDVKREPDAAPIFVLDSNRLATYTDDATQFDNRHVAGLPNADDLRKLGIRHVLYVSAFTGSYESDDLNDYFVAYLVAEVDVRIVRPRAFKQGPDGVMYYGGEPETNLWFWSDYPWAPGLENTGRNPMVNDLGSYRPITRSTSYSGNKPAALTTRVTPANFATVPVLVDKSTRAIVGVSTVRSGTVNRTSGAGCGG